MEAFSLLKYWRGGGGGGGVAAGGAPDVCVNVRPNSATTTIVAAVAQNSGETDDDEDDDGPFFDLEFAVPDEDEAEEEGGQNRERNRGSDSDEDDDEEEVECEGVEEVDREFGFSLSSASSNDRTDPNLSLSPSDDLFFKGKLVPIESSSLVFNPAEPNSNKPPQFPVSLLKSATKFRVFMLGFKKSRMNGAALDKAAEAKAEESKTEANGSVAGASKQQQQMKSEKQQEQQKQQQQQQSKFFTVKFKVEEVPIMSLFTRDNSSRSSSSSKSQKQQQQSPSDESTASEEKRFAKEVVQKYLKIVKPLYVRVSKRYGEKLSSNGTVEKASAASPPQVPATSTQKPIPSKPPADKSQPEAEASEASPSNVKNQKQGNFPTGLRVVCKHLGKSRSASSAVAAVPPPGTVPSRRRDDSLLQQQDGIQSAILHCKRSFNASRDSESSLLSRSVSDPTNEKSLDMSMKSSEEGKAADLQAQRP